MAADVALSQALAYARDLKAVCEVWQERERELKHANTRLRHAHRQSLRYAADLKKTYWRMARAADVTLKEGRPLILLVRETPLHLGHLRLLTHLAEAGAVILPPMPAFYNRPKQIDEIVDHTLARVLDRLRLPQSLVPEWRGEPPAPPGPRTERV